MKHLYEILIAVSLVLLAAASAFAANAIDNRATNVDQATKANQNQASGQTTTQGQGSSDAAASQDDNRKADVVVPPGKSVDIRDKSAIEIARKDYKDNRIGKINTTGTQGMGTTESSGTAGQTGTSGSATGTGTSGTGTGTGTEKSTSGTANQSGHRNRTR